MIQVLSLPDHVPDLMSVYSPPAIPGLEICQDLFGPDGLSWLQRFNHLTDEHP
jgi:hypothetical protein